MLLLLECARGGPSTQHMCIVRYQLRICMCMCTVCIFRWAWWRMSTFISMAVHIYTRMVAHIYLHGVALGLRISITISVIITAITAQG